jgi:hypothetical protein
MQDVLEMSVDIRLKTREWAMILALLKEKSPKDYNQCIVNLERELREQTEQAFTVYREGILGEIFDCDLDGGETQELRGIKALPEIETEFEAAKSPSFDEDEDDYKEKSSNISLAEDMDTQEILFKEDEDEDELLPRLLPSSDEARDNAVGH